MRRTKIVATIGPASRERKVLESLAQAGVDVVRLNFSHGEHEQHLEVMQATREIAAHLGRPIALLQDLSGPKIRTGRLKDDKPVELRTGERVTITTDESIEGTAKLISTTYAPLPRDVSPGDRILLDDGNLELRVVRASLKEVECEVVDGGWLKSKKGMNLPGVKLSTPALTEKDRRDLAFGVKNGVDYVALSFVRQAADVSECKALIKSLGGTCPVIAKIEKREAIDDLTAILEATDGVMVARGDLGVELSTEEVPTLQKRIIERANAAGKVVITATQMLESMVDNPRPTRAEASDVANAILDGTDGIFGGDGLRSLPGRGGGHHGAHRLLHRGAIRRLPHARARQHPHRVRGGQRARPRGPHGGGGARLQADHRLHGVGHHRPPPLHLPAPRPHRRRHLQPGHLPAAGPVVGGGSGKVRIRGATDGMIVKGEALLKAQGLIAKGTPC
jgi:hypothetical protein